MKAQSKIEARAKKMTFVGFEDGPSAVRYYDASKRFIGVSRDAWFNENDALERKQPDDNLDMSPLYMEGEKPDEKTPEPSKDDAAIEGETQNDDRAPLTTTETPTKTPTTAHTPSYRFRERKTADYATLHNPRARPNENPAQQARPAAPDTEEQAHLTRIELAEVALATLFDVPSNLADAKASPESENWEKAMQKELGMLEERKTWRLESLPPGRSTVGCTWTYAKKFDADGNSQIPGQDFNHSMEAVVYQYDKPFGYGCWMTSITTMNHIFIFLGYSEFPRWLPW